MKYILTLIKIIGLIFLIHYFAYYIAPILAYLLFFHFDIDFGLNNDFDIFYKKVVIIIGSFIILYEICKYLFNFFFFTQSGKILFYIIVIIFFIINNCL